jgi:hypothetical protein
MGDRLLEQSTAIVTNGVYLGKYRTVGSEDARDQGFTTLLPNGVVLIPRVVRL